MGEARGNFLARRIGRVSSLNMRARFGEVADFGKAHAVAILDLPVARRALENLGVANDSLVVLPILEGAIGLLLGSGHRPRARAGGQRDGNEGEGRESNE